MRICIECGERLIGRQDKVYCNQHCRNDYHNFKRKNKNGFTAIKINALIRNIKVLQLKYRQENNKIFQIKLEVLNSLGFDLHACIFMRKSENKEYWKCHCFDIEIISGQAIISLSEIIVEKQSK